VLLVAGCGTVTSEYDAPIHERYQVPEKASAECIAAAKRASYWCPPLEKLLWPEQQYELNCNQARWDYSRECR
jgi:hypothetical protein